MYIKFHIFDVVNPDAVLAGERPQLLEKGPYTYRETREKRDISFVNGGEFIE